jgi:predicted nucleic acid-binding protein
VSELRKEHCHLAVRAWADAQPAQSVHLSTVTLAEIRFGIGRSADPAFRVELEGWLDRVLRPWFAGRILAVGEDVILRWRELVELGRRRVPTNLMNC